MGYESQIACGDRVAECGYRRGECHESGYGAAGVVAKSAVVEHHVVAVAHQAHVDMQSRTGFAYGDF